MQTNLGEFSLRSLLSPAPPKRTVKVDGIMLVSPHRLSGPQHVSVVRGRGVFELFWSSR